MFVTWDNLREGEKESLGLAALEMHACLWQPSLIGYSRWVHLRISADSCGLQLRPKALSQKVKEIFSFVFFSPLIKLIFFFLARTLCFLSLWTSSNTVRALRTPDTSGLQWSRIPIKQILNARGMTEQNFSFALLLCQFLLAFEEILLNSCQESHCAKEKRIWVQILLGEGALVNFTRYHVKNTWKAIF